VSNNDMYVSDLPIVALISSGNAGNCRELNLWPSYHLHMLQLLNWCCIYHTIITWISMCRQDDPTMSEKVDMVQSINDTFPVLKDPVTGGFVSCFSWTLVHWQ